MSLLLPGKHTPASGSLLRQAELLYVSIDDVGPVAQAWLHCRELVLNVSFQRFVLMLDVLFALQVIEFSDSQIIKRRRDASTT